MMRGGVGGRVAYRFLDPFEVYLPRDKPKPRPERWTAHSSGGPFCHHAADPQPQAPAVTQWLRLARGPGPNARQFRARGEIGIGFGRPDEFDLAVDIHSLAHVRPIEQQRRMTVFANIHRLAAAEIGVESKPARVAAFNWTMRAEGRPPAVAVARTIAVASCPFSFPASPCQRRNRTSAASPPKGQQLACHASPVPTR